MIQASTVIHFGDLRDMENIKSTFHQTGKEKAIVLHAMLWFMSFCMGLDCGMSNKDLIEMITFGWMKIIWIVMDGLHNTRNVIIVKPTMSHMITKVLCIMVHLLGVKMVIACILWLVYKIAIFHKFYVGHYSTERMYSRLLE